MKKTLLLFMVAALLALSSCGGKDDGSQVGINPTISGIISNLPDREELSVKAVLVDYHINDVVIASSPIVNGLFSLTLPDLPEMYLHNYEYDPALSVSDKRVKTCMVGFQVHFRDDYLAPISHMYSTRIGEGGFSSAVVHYLYADRAASIKGSYTGEIRTEIGGYADATYTFSLHLAKGWIRRVEHTTGRGGGTVSCRVDNTLPSTLEWVY